MANLSDTDRARIWRGLMRWWSQERETVEIVKADLRDAVDATDSWIDDNQAAYNSALPEAARNGLTTTQKALLFCTVALARSDLSLLRRVLGEVD